MLSSTGVFLEKYNDNESSSSDEFSSAGGSTNPSDLLSNDDHKQRQELQRQLLQTEEQAVRRWRLIVFLAMLASAITVAASVFRFARQGDQKSFELEYNGFTEDMLSLVQWELRYNFALTEQLSATITTHALQQQQNAPDHHAQQSTFPNVTDDHFEINGGFVDGMSGMALAVYAPFVPRNSREAWEAYAVVEGPRWLNRSIQILQTFDGHEDPLKGTIQDHESASEDGDEDGDDGDEDGDDGDSDDEDGDSDDGDEDSDDGDEGDEDDESGSGSGSSDSGDIYEGPIDVAPHIYRWIDGKRVNEVDVTPDDDEYYLPMWQFSPASAPEVNTNLLAHPEIAKLARGIRKTRQSILSPTIVMTEDIMFDFVFDEDEKDEKENPHSFVMTPVYESFEKDAPVVGVILALTEAQNLINGLLPDTAPHGIHVVWEDTCGKQETFQVNGDRAIYLGPTDQHEPEFDDYLIQRENMEIYDTIDDDTMCAHTMRIYPSIQFRRAYDTDNPRTYTLLVVLSFVLMTVLLIVFDCQVTRRQNKTMTNLLRTDKFIATLFPENVRDRILDNNDSSENDKKKHDTTLGGLGKALLRKDEDHQLTPRDKDEDGLYTSKPIADFFPESTIMFADIAGFTAWSSAREPHQVFVLLETLYGAFDEMAKRRRVFKVETVGDCYVAACGLPTPRKDHAVAMARFANDCLKRMKQWTSKLEFRLGPDTADLSLRVGLHSGQVTAGVLRGENARFQLFGDTVNTCSRIETTGTPGRIHVSDETAKLLLAAGKGNWLVLREDKVIAKGKGELQTFWVNITPRRPGSTSSGTDASETARSEVDDFDECPIPTVDERLLRLVGWNVDVLGRLLRQIEANRRQRRTTEGKWLETAEESGYFEAAGMIGSKTIDEVKEVIELPPPLSSSSAPNVNVNDIALEAEVLEQLRSYVTAIAAAYRRNPFHNFEHASHVTMSVCKLMARIVAPRQCEPEQAPDDDDNTYGITSDPLTQFACVLSAIIHDVDHSGVPNSQLVKEGVIVARHYDNRSVAEQNSIDLAWTLLMEDQYEQLRRAIYRTDVEYNRFRALVVNSVMATDIMDKNLKQIRNDRWDRAFTEEARSRENINRRATIVIEHLIQASDVAHTMQHWHVYRKWNTRLFEECLQAYKEGRAEKDPSENWYQGELGFFDFYIIPLARKLKDCGVFGVSSEECLNYAMKNREEWELKGKEVVAEMVEQISKQ